MKLNKTYFIITAVALGLFAGCNNEDPGLTAFDNKVYIESTSKVSEFLVKPTSGDETRSMVAAIPRPQELPINLQFKAAPELVGRFNQAYYEQAVMLPEEHYEIPVTESVIPVGGVKSSTIDIHFKSVAMLDREVVYVLPVTIVEATNIPVLEGGRTMYYLFKGAALVNVVANIDQNFLQLAEKNPDVLNNLSQMTLEALVRLSEIPADRNILSLIGIEGKFLIRTGDSNAPGQLQVATSAGNFPDRDALKVLPVKQWVHIAVSYDQSAANRIKIYIDGRLQSEGNTSGNFSGAVSFSSSMTTPDRLFYIGRSYDGARWWPGEVSECRIWNRVLSAEEINASGHFYTVEPDSEGLVAYWKMDEGTGDICKDYTSNGNNLTAEESTRPDEYKPLKWTKVSLPEQQ